ncbi:3200_t:CDS:2, partial [Rhizophagus irregularis]
TLLPDTSHMDDPSLISVQSQFNPSLNPIRYQSESNLITVFPSPKEYKHLLVPGVLAKNADIWIKYVFREAYGLSGKTLGGDFQTS